MGKCLEELPELSKGGIDEGAICDVSGSIYLGEHGCYVNHRTMTYNINKLAFCTGGEDTVGGILVASSFQLIFPFSKASSSIETFFLAATLYPEVVRLAQQELDLVIGRGRLPHFSDKPQLPYISAIMKEVLRWRPPTPLGTAFLEFFFFRSGQAEATPGGGHLAREDDVYNGISIPAGSLTIDNTWCVMVLRTCLITD